MNLNHLRDRIDAYRAPTRIILFLLTLLLLWLPIAAPMYLLFGEAVGLGLTILLYCGFLGLIGIWGSKIARYPHPYRHYGLQFTRANWLNFTFGWGLGAVTLLIFYSLQLRLGWLTSQVVTWQAPLPDQFLPMLGVYFVDWQGAIAPGILTAFGVGLAEEILFRGWMLSELERDYSPNTAMIAASLVFAILHFIKPLEVILATWSQFAGLLTLGITLVMARRRFDGRLGAAIGLHGGLVWGYYIVNTTHWFQPTGSVPEWVTGIGGNPIAGVMGIVFLGTIAVSLRRPVQKT